MKIVAPLLSESGDRLAIGFVVPEFGAAEFPLAEESLKIDELGG
jgi:hypothetical protein